jgi:hypothetical protein
MITEETAQRVSDALFAAAGPTVYAVVDGASVPDLLDKLYGLLPEFACLERGELEPDVAEVAPYLVRLEADSEFARWLIGEGWGKHWCIYATSRDEMRALRRHFQSLFIVHDAEGTPLYFRFYDPRVLRRFLPTCSSEELARMFGPVALFLLEDGDLNTVLQFRLTGGALDAARLPPQRRERAV